MQIELLLSHFGRPRYRNIFFDAELFPKDGHCAPNLHMRDHFTIYTQNLLFFHMISNEAIIINSAGIVPRTCSFVHTSRYQSHSCRFIAQHACILPKKALNQRREPFTLNLLLLKLAV